MEVGRPMKVVHVPFSFHPDPAGGTEVYVEALARYQQEMGLNVTVAAPGMKNDAYMHQGLAVRRYRVSGETLALRNLYAMDDPVAADSFAPVLSEEAPDLLHLHAFTSGVSNQLVSLAKTYGIPVAFTYHTPTVSCQRGTLFYFGPEVCHGGLDARRCASGPWKGLGRRASVCK